MAASKFSEKASTYFENYIRFLYAALPNFFLRSPPQIDTVLKVYEMTILMTIFFSPVTLLTLRQTLCHPAPFATLGCVPE